MNKGLRIAFYCIFPLVFNLLFFAVGGAQHPLSVWLAYGFIHLAWLLLAAAPLLTPAGDSKGLFSLSLSSITLVYFVLELLIGLIIILIHPQSAKASVVIQILLLALYAAAALPVMMANQHSTENTRQLQLDAEDIGDLCARVKALFDVIPDERLNRELERTYHALHAAPIANTKGMNEISYELRQAEAAIAEHDPEKAIVACKKIQNYL